MRSPSIHNGGETVRDRDRREVPYICAPLVLRSQRLGGGLAVWRLYKQTNKSERGTARTVGAGAKGPTAPNPRKGQILPDSRSHTYIYTYFPYGCEVKIPYVCEGNRMRACRASVTKKNKQDKLIAHVTSDNADAETSAGQNSCFTWDYL